MCRDLIKNEYTWFLENFDNYPKHIQRADSVRYFILYHYGGLYADLDCEVREGFYQYLDQNKINLAQSPYHDDGMMNNLMASPKKIELWKNVFSTLETKKNISSTLESTGPGVLTDTFKEKNNINVLGYNEFNPLKKRPYFYGLIENTFFVPLDNEKAENWHKAYVVHHGSESWRREEILTIIYENKFFLFLFFVLLILFVGKYALYSN
jgi:mannosyltransferase OCH1-like enzyme